MKRTAAIGAGVTVLATALVGALALLGVTRLPVVEFLVWPGSMAAWLYRGDDYASSREFIVYSLAFAVPINAVLGAGLALAVRFVRNHLSR